MLNPNFATHSMLCEWLSKGNGVYKTHNGIVKNHFEYPEDFDDKTIELRDLKIRWFGTDVWVDPTVDNIMHVPDKPAGTVRCMDAPNDPLTYVGQLPTGKDGDVIEFADGTSGIIKCLGSDTPPENACRVPTDEDGSPRLVVKERYDFIKNTTGIDYDDDIELTTYELLQYCKHNGLYHNTVPTLPPHSRFFTMKDLVKRLMCNPMLRLVAYLDNTDITFNFTTIGSEGKHVTVTLANDFWLDVYHDMQESNTDFRVVKNIRGSDGKGQTKMTVTEEHWDVDDLLEYIGYNAED